MKLSGFKKVLEKLYSDRMSISRYTVTQNLDGTTDSKRSLTPVHTNVPCRISFNQNDNPESFEDDANPIFLQIKLFCGVDVDLRKGDYLIVDRLAEDGTTVLASYQGLANLPAIYVTHQEAQMAQIGDA